MTQDQLREKLEGLYQEAVFLIDRLDDHENNIADDETANDWHGHVAPSLHRFRSQLPLLLDALGRDDKYRRALNQIADLGSCAGGKTPAHKLFQRAIDIATGAL